MEEVVGMHHGGCKKETDEVVEKPTTHIDYGHFDNLFELYHRSPILFDLHRVSKFVDLQQFLPTTPDSHSTPTT